MRKLIVRKLTIPLSLVLCSTACFDPYAKDSKIVREVEAAGSGDLTTFTDQGLRVWFAKRPTLAVRIFAECRPIERTAPVNWPTTAEGSVCAAARMEQPVVFSADPRAW